MKFSVSCILSIAGAMLLFLVATSEEQQVPVYSVQQRIKARYIVKIKDGYGVDMVEKQLRSLPGFRLAIPRVRILKKIHRVLRALVIDMGSEDLNLISQLDGVEYVEEDGLVRAQAVNSWGLDRIDQRDRPLDGKYIPKMLNRVKGKGAGTNIYIVDTGINPTHQDVSGRASTAYDFDNDGDGDDCNGHGSHCSGTAAGTKYGVATKAKVHGVRVLNCFGTGTHSQVIGGLDWIAVNGTRPSIASISLSGSASVSLDQAVRNLIQSGVTTVVAAGSGNTDACAVSPARVYEAITASASDENDHLSSSSNYGSCVDIFAPGVNIASTWYTSSSATRTLSGTSMACAHVAGAAAIEMSMDFSLEPATLTQYLIKNATYGCLDMNDATSDTPNRLLYIGRGEE